MGQTHNAKSKKSKRMMRRDMNETGMSEGREATEGEESWNRNKAANPCVRGEGMERLERKRRGKPRKKKGTLNADANRNGEKRRDRTDDGYEEEGWKGDGRSI